MSKTTYLPEGPIVFAGDWHGSLQQAFRAIDHAKESGAETVLHVGDFGIWPGETKKFLDRLNVRLVKEDLGLAFVDGNHEDHPWLAVQPRDETGIAPLRSNIAYLPRGVRIGWGNSFGPSILAMGGASSIDRERRIQGKSWWIEELISDDDVQRAVDGPAPVNEPFYPHADILLSHDSPYGAPNVICDDDFGQLAAARYFGEHVLAECTEHRKQLKKVSDATTPYLVVHGHYHAYMAGEFRHADGSAAMVVGLDQGTNAPGRSTLLVSMHEFRMLQKQLDKVGVDENEQGGIVRA